MIKSRKLRWAGHVARMDERRSAFKILTGKPTGKRPVGRPRRRWRTISEWIFGIFHVLIPKLREAQ